MYIIENWSELNPISITYYLGKREIFSFSENSSKSWVERTGDEQWRESVLRDKDEGRGWIEKFPFCGTRSKFQRSARISNLGERIVGIRTIFKISDEPFWKISRRYFWASSIRWKFHGRVAFLGGHCQYAQVCGLSSRRR